MNYQIRTILYPADFGPHGPEVLNHAVGLAQQFGAKIHVVHAVEPVSEYAHALINSYVSPDAMDKLQQEGFEEARQEMHRRLEAFFKEKLHAGTEHLVAEMRVVEGLPFQVILDEAKRVGADLIVVGSHGMTALGEMLIGSVAHKVITKSTVPVLLVPIGRE